MKRILALSILASLALGILSGCGVVQSNMSAETYKKAIQIRARNLVSTNTAALGQNYWSPNPVNTNNYSSYPQLWSALVGHILNFQATQGFTRESYPRYVALLTRFALVMSRPGSASYATGLNFGGLGYDFSNGGLSSSSLLPVSYFGSQNDTFNNELSFYGSYLNGVSWQ